MSDFSSQDKKKAILNELLRRGIDPRKQNPHTVSQSSSPPETDKKQAILNELLKRGIDPRKKSPKPLEEIVPPANEPKGFFESLGKGFTTGITEDIPRQAQTIYDVATEEPEKILPQEITPSKEWELSRESIGENVGRMAANAIPGLASTLGGAGLGAAVGTALAPGPGTIVGGLLGTATGGGAVGGAQSFADFYNEARANGVPHEKALEAAKNVGYTSAAINSISGGLGGVGLKAAQKAILPYITKQMGIQGAATAADVAQTNIAAKESHAPEREITEGIIPAVLGSAAFQGLPYALAAPKIIKEKLYPKEVTKTEPSLEPITKELTQEGIVPTTKEAVEEIKEFSTPQIKAEENLPHAETENIELIKKKVFGEEPEKKGVLNKLEEKISPLFDEPFRKLEANIFDKYSPIKKYDPEGKLLRQVELTQNTSGMLNTALNHGTLSWNPEEKTVYRKNDKGLKQILSPVLDNPEKLKNFEAYAYAKRGKENEFIEKGKEKNITKEDQTALLNLEKEHPEFKQTFSELQDFQNSFLDLYHQTGMISKDAFDKWKEMPYVPFYRLFEEGISGKSISPFAKWRSLVGQRDRTKELTGGKDHYAVFSEDGDYLGRFPTKEEANEVLPPNGEIHDVGPPTADIVQNVVQNVDTMLGASLRNAAANEVINAAKEGGITKSIHKDEAYYKGKLKSDVVQTMVDGKREFFKVEDPLLFDALSNTISPNQPGNIVTSSLEWMKKKISGLIMMNPATQLSVGMKDIILSRMLGKDPVPIWGNTVKNLGASLRHEIAESYGEGSLGGLGKIDPRALDIMSMGGDSRFYDNASEKVKERFFKIAEDNERKLEKNYNAQILSLVNPKKYYELLEKLSRAAELSTRLSVYDSAKKNGASPVEAVSQSLDYMNYNKRGSHPFINFLAKTVPFLNSHLTSLHKVGGEINRGGKPFLNKTGKAIGVLSSLSMLNALNNLREDETEEDKANNYFSLPQHLRDTKMIVDLQKLLGKQTTQEMGLSRFLMIPMPWEIGILAGVVPGKIVEAMAGSSDFNESFDFLTRTFGDTFSFNPLGNPLLKEPIQQWANKDIFTDRPIVSEVTEKLTPELQYGPYTPKLAKEAGKLTGISPDRLDHAAKSFLGLMYTYPSMAVEAIYGSEKPNKKLSEKMFFNQVLKDTHGSTEYQKEFYDIFRNMEQVYSSAKKLRELGEVDALQEYMDRPGNKELVSKRKALQGIKKQLKSIYNYTLKIQDSPLSPDEKQKQIEDLNKNRNIILFRFHQIKKDVFKK